MKFNIKVVDGGPAPAPAEAEVDVSFWLRKNPTGSVSMMIARSDDKTYYKQSAPIFTVGTDGRTTRHAFSIYTISGYVPFLKYDDGRVLDCGYPEVVDE